MVIEIGGDLRTSSQEIARIFGEKRRKASQLTYSLDTDYFWGRAGFFRLLALVCSMLAFIFGLPGFYTTDPKLIGYGSSPFIYVSISFNGIAMLISMVWILGLLLFREVRYEEYWDEANMKWHVVACVLCIVAGFSEIFAMNKVRLMNCPTCPKPRTQYTRRADTLPDSYRPEYWSYHNASFMMKISASLLFSFCSRVYLKNDD